MRTRRVGGRTPFTAKGGCVCSRSRTRTCRPASCSRWSGSECSSRHMPRTSWPACPSSSWSTTASLPSSTPRSIRPRSSSASSSLSPRAFSPTRLAPATSCSSRPAWCSSQRWRASSPFPSRRSTCRTCSVASRACSWPSTVRRSSEAGFLPQRSPWPSASPPRPRPWRTRSASASRLSCRRSSLPLP